MKLLLSTLAATAALGIALLTPANAEAGQVRLSVHLGIPVIVDYPRVAYRPAPHFRHHYYRRHHWDHGYHRGWNHRRFDYRDSHRRGDHAEYRGHRGYAPSNTITEIHVNPRLGR